uniref:Uncharacterized protein n=1 Tax=Oryza rufipogon TaxID=4529 RepID=A0A0E0PXY9_ORYRU
MAARRGGGRRGARRRGGRAVCVGAEWRPDPPPPCVLPTVAHHSRTLRYPCKIHARSARVGRGAAAGCAASSPPTRSHPLPLHPAVPCWICRCRARHQSVMEVEPPRLQPAFARRFRAHNRVEPDPPMSHPSPLDSRGGAVAPPARQRCARSRPSPPCP